MKIALSVPVICLLALFALAQQKPQPLNAKTGQWQISETDTWTGVPPQYAAMMKNGHTRTYKKCVKTADLSSNPWAEPDQNCTWKVLKSNGTDMEVQASSCEVGNGVTVDAQGTIHVSDTQDGTGSLDFAVNGNGPNMKGHAAYTGKWVSATCADGVN